MNHHTIFNHKTTFIALAASLLIVACTKYQNGFISPTMQYSVSTFTVIKGHLASSNSLVSDGSTIPLNIKWTHIYDATGNIADSLFLKKRIVSVWTSAYNSLTDTTYALITAKRAATEMPALVVNPTSGVIQANSSTYYLPTGTYTMDLEVSNSAGTQQLKKAMTIVLVDGKPLETNPETGAYSLSRLIANTASGASNGTMFNGNNNPFVRESITRLADTPNTITVTITDRNDKPFSPLNGEIAKRPNSGLNPIPPFLQNLQDYAPDTYKATDTSMFLQYPLVPFPIASLGNGYNMYYRIPTKFVHIDSTSSWTANNAGNYYKGNADSHYLGTFKDDLYDYSIRIPMREQVPGKYVLHLKLLNATHR